MSNNTSNNTRLAKNTLFLYLRMFIVLVVSLYTSREVLHVLGVEDYGIYNVVAGFVSLFGFLNTTLASSIQRYYNYEGTKNGSRGYNKVYSTSIQIQFLLSIIILLLLESFGVWYVNHVMKVPLGRLTAANWVFQCSILSMVFVLFQIPYSGLVMAMERMDFYAIVSIIDVFLRLAIIILLPHLDGDLLILYGVLSLAISVLNFGLYYGYIRFIFKDLSLKFVFYRDLFRDMVSFSVWNLVGTFSFMLKGQGLNVLLNAFWGPIVNAARGIAFQINSAIASFSGSISLSFRPQIVNSYANGEIQRTVKLMFSESKICFSLIATLIVPAILEIDLLLHLWLGNVIPENSQVFSVLVLIDLLICTLNTPCTQMVMATGYIKSFQIASSIVNLCLLPACFILLKIGLNPNSVFIATIVFSVVNQTVCLYFTNKQVGFGLRNYMKRVLTPCLLYIAFLPIVPLIISIKYPDSIGRFIVIIVLDIIISSVLFYRFVLDKEERVVLWRIVSKKIKK